MPTQACFERARTLRTMAAGPVATLLVTLLGALAACHDAAPPALESFAPLARLQVVSLSPAASELLLALDLADTLIGVDPESSRLAGLSDLPVLDLAETVRLAPDLALVPDLGTERDASLARLREREIEVIEVVPHNLDDAFELCRRLGDRLGRRAAAERFVRAQARPLALISSRSVGSWRPRVAAVIGLVPLELAGGHSFASDVIEIAGAESVGHGVEQPRLSTSPARLAELAPDLVLVVSARELSQGERERARRALAPLADIAFFALDAERFWLRDPDRVTRSLQALLPAARK